MLNGFFLKLKEQPSDSILFLIISSFFLRLAPALLFFGSSEITAHLQYFENIAPGQFPMGSDLVGISAPMRPILQYLFFLQDLTGIPLVFWLKFPGILADVSITCTIYLLTYRATQDSKKAFSLGSIYAFHPLSIFITSFVGSDVSLALAILLLAFWFFFADPIPALSAVFLGTSIALENICLLFLPVFLLKSKNGATSVIFIAFSFLAFFAWGLPDFFSGEKFLFSPDVFSKLPSETNFGLSVALKDLALGKFNAPLPELLIRFSSFLHPICQFLLDNFSFFFLGGVVSLIIFHNRYNAFVLSYCLILWAILILPCLQPFYIIFVLPFSLLTTGRGGNALFLSASLFLLSWYSVIAVESGTFCGVKFINSIFSNFAVFQEEWIHWIHYFTGNLLLPISLWFCILTSCFFYI